MKRFEEIFGLDEIELAKILKNVRKIYIKKDEYEESEDIDKDVYNEVKNKYGEEPDKFYVATLAMDIMDIDIRNDLKQEINDSWNTLMKRIMG